MKQAPLCLSPVLPWEGRGCCLHSTWKLRAVAPQSAPLVTVLADDCGPFCTSNKSAAGASLWGSQPSDCQRPSTQDVTLACMIYLTPSPWNSFAEKEKHDICMVNDFLKGRKKTSKLLCSMKWASKRIAFSKFISISQLDGYQPLVGGKNPTRLMQPLPYLKKKKKKTVLFISYWSLGKVRKQDICIGKNSEIHIFFFFSLYKTHTHSLILP